MKQLQRLWQGDLTLDNAFWNWAVIGGLFINAGSSAMFLMLITLDRPVAAALAGYTFSVPYNIVVAVGVWRSAERHPGERRHADLARIVTVIGAILFSVT